MAILQMKKLKLAVPGSQKDELLKDLFRGGCVQFSEVEAGEDTDLARPQTSDLVTYRTQQGAIVHAISLLDRYAPVKTPMLSAKPELERAAFLDTEGLEGSIECAEAIVTADARIRAISTEESRTRSEIEALTPWKDLDLRLDCDGTKYAAVTLGAIPARVSLDEVDTALAQVSEEADLYRVNSDKAAHYVALVCIREALPELTECLRGFGFNATTLAGMSGTAAECLAADEETLKSLAAEKAACNETIINAGSRRDELKLAADKLAAQMAIAEAGETLGETERCVVMEGWMPAEREAEMAQVFEKYDCAWETADPVEDEYAKVPVKLKNNKFSNALNMVTDMYSLPKYGTVDPNPLMAPFFILFFGLMMADMGYGIIMIAAAIVAMKKIKPRGGTLAFCQLLLYGGIATFICGALTGGFFSDIPYQLVHIFNPESTWKGLPYLFSPVYNSEMVLYGAMVLGAIHLNTGMAVNFVQKKKAGNLAGAIWEEGSLWVLLVGIILFVLKKGNIAGIPVVLVIGILMLLFGAGREAKGFGKVTAAFACIYNTATGWFGDVLSYSRIMALMLAGGVVGQVFNTVATMPMKSAGVNPVTVIAFVIIFVLGHAMNFGLNLLGCYVHDLRLQCLEYFGKFYTDGGKAFRPLDVRGKYVLTKESQY